MAESRTNPHARHPDDPRAELDPSGRTVLVMITVPPTMLHDDEATLRRKLLADHERIIAFVAHEVRKHLDAPNLSPEQIAARLLDHSGLIAQQEREMTRARMLELGLLPPRR